MVDVGGDRLHAREEFVGHRDVEPEEVLDLREQDQHRDAVGEADDDRHGDEADEAAHARDAHGEQQNTGCDRADDEVGDAVLRDDTVHDHDVRAGRPADLHARAAEQRDQETSDDRGEDAGLRRDARRDRERHRERQCHDADREAGDGVGAEVVARVSGGEAIHEPRAEPRRAESQSRALIRATHRCRRGPRDRRQDALHDRSGVGGQPGTRRRPGSRSTRGPGSHSSRRRCRRCSRNRRSRRRAWARASRRRCACSATSMCRDTGPGDEQHVGVARARDELDAEPFEVVVRIVERVDLELAAVARARVDVADRERAGRSVRRTSACSARGDAQRLRRAAGGALGLDAGLSAICLQDRARMRDLTPATDHARCTTG